MRTGRKRTKKYLELYGWIVQYKAEHNGNSPSIREIMAGMGLSSTSVVNYMLRRLEEDGRVQRTPAGLVVSGGEWRMGKWNTRPLEDALQARIAELEAVTRWIPVSERLPEERQNILALDYTGTAYHWDYSKRLVNIFTSDYTHWMPLPELPRIE